MSYETLTLIVTFRAGVFLNLACDNVSLQVVAFLGATNFPALILHPELVVHFAFPLPLSLINEVSDLLLPLPRFLTTTAGFDAWPTLMVGAE